MQSLGAISCGVALVSAVPFPRLGKLTNELRVKASEMGISRGSDSASD